MSLVSVQDYIRLHNARSQYNPISHVTTILFPNGTSMRYATQIINGASFINV